MGNSSLMDTELKVGWYGSEWWYRRRRGRRLVEHDNASSLNATTVDPETTHLVIQNSSLMNTELKVGWYGSEWWYRRRRGRRLIEQDNASSQNATTVDPEATTV